MRRLLLATLFLAIPALASAQPVDGECDEDETSHGVDGAGSLARDLDAVFDTGVLADGDVVPVVPPPIAPVLAPAPLPLPTRVASPPLPARDALPFHVAGIPDAKLAVALRAYTRASARGLVSNRRLTIIDFSLPSSRRRLWVIDPRTGQILFHELVAHGAGSGEVRAERFGNTPDSHRTSLGVFRASETYSGGHGHSLRLDGHDPGVNDRARARAIVIHAADYVTDAFVRAHGRTGRSHGCPAVDPRISRRLIDEIRGGSIVVAFGGDDAWVDRSPLARP